MVIDNLPVLIPVTVSELDAIQMYLGDLIDRLIADAISAAGTKSSSTRATGNSPSGLKAF